MNNKELVKCKGRKEYQKFLNKEKLTRKEVILAQCYICYIITAAPDELDCLCDTCPVYAYMPYKKTKNPEFES